MNRKFWRWLERVASDKLAKDEMRTNWIGVKNEFHSLHGAIQTSGDHTTAALAARLETEISEQFKSAGPIIVQKVNENTNRAVSDGAVVVKEMLDDKVRGFIERGNSVLASIMGRTFINIEGLSTCVKKWFAEISQQAVSLDRNNSERYLALNEQLRILSMKVEANQDINLKTQTALYEGLMAEIKMLKTPQETQHFSPAPSLEWVMDNLDEIIEMAEIANAVKHNNAPRENTIYKLVSAIRRLELYSAIDVRDEVVSKINTWDNDTPNVRLVA